MNKAEQLIACLEGEIAKRDARIVELERYQFAFNEWHDKTEWVQAESATLSAKYLGCHRADVMRSLIDGLRAELAALKAQGTVGEVVGWYRLDRPYEMTSYPSVCATWHKLGAPVAPLYAAPVSEAKAQGDDWAPSVNDYDHSIHSNPDAREWADFFVATFPGLADKHDLMIGWFANAMMAMHDHLARKAQGVVMPDEREAFEKWGETLFYTACFERHGNDEYAGRGLQGAWLGWQARAALNAALSAGKGGE